jgi:hypothetical protein
MRTKSKRKKPVEEYVEPAKAPNPTIPNELLKAFLDERISLADATKVTQVVDGFLWEKDNVQRYRVNVWMSEPVEGMFCDRNYIGGSWFVHYNTKTKILTDKTTGQVEEDKKSSKKLNGIANGDTRVGKAFR